MTQQKKRKQKKALSNQLIYEMIGLAILALMIISFAQLGFVGQFVYDIFQFFTGDWTIFCFIGLLSFAVYLIWKRTLPNIWSRRLLGCYLLIVAILLFAHSLLLQTLLASGLTEESSIIGYTWQLFWSQTSGTASPALGGGMIGAFGLMIFYWLFAMTGTIIVTIILMIIALILITDLSFGELLTYMVNGTRALYARFKQRRQQKSQQQASNNHQKAKQKEPETIETITPESSADASSQSSSEPVIHDFNAADHSQQTTMAATNDSHTEQQDSSNDDDQHAETTLATTEAENVDYQLPPLTLFHLSDHQAPSSQREYIQENTRKLERTFESFGVNAKIRKVHLGPAVTKYEVYPDVGVKVSKIVSLQDDIALALAAKDIRIEAPIPGKSAVGIEVPNQDVSMVSLREVLESQEARQSEHKLSIALGRDISGDPVMANLSTMPHLLVAGSTGSGKSVCINAIVTSILTRAKPHEVKLMMIDPKMVELNVYNGIPHLLAPVVVEPKKASQALKKIVAEMEHRYELFSQSGTRNIESYNAWLKEQPEDVQEKKSPLPYIVVIVDELADLMMVASKEVEDAITRLSQMARAAGIHMIIATQRPSVDVITGVIKANIPSRIAFNVSSQTDSRTILDAGGADKLLGKGDMLFLPVGSSKPTRIQGVFLSDDEVENVVDYIVDQQKAQYEENMIPSEETQETVDVEDDYYHDAVKLIVGMETASVSMLQRKFRIGYTRAARLIDAMEANGIVGPYEGSKPRKVLVSQVEHHEPTDDESNESQS